MNDFFQLFIQDGGLKDRLNSETFIGIDFGTSTTTVARLGYDQAGGCFLVEPLNLTQHHVDGRQEDNNLVPTAIAWDGKKYLYGIGAKECIQDTNRYLREVNAWSEFKMSVGMKKVYPKTKRSRANNVPLKECIETPQQAAVLFFKWLKARLDESCRGKNLPEKKIYTVTVPASFATAQRSALRKALVAAGIPAADTHLLDEPNAAFLGTIAYYTKEKNEAQLERFTERMLRVLIFDFGAGTCDISLLEKQSDQRIRNMAISHFTALGGRNIDQKIAKEILLPQLIRANERLSGEENIRDETKLMFTTSLEVKAEELKKQICNAYSKKKGLSGGLTRAAEKDEHPFTTHLFSFISKRYGKLRLQAPSLTPRDFIGICQSFTKEPQEGEREGKSVLTPVENVLDQSKLKKGDVDIVILVGGSSRNPFVREALEKYFGRGTEILEPGDIQTLVARGAAWHAYCRGGLNEEIIAPITSEDIRIVTDGRQGDPDVLIFPAGTAVPQRLKRVEAKLTLGWQGGGGGTFYIPFFSATRDKRFGTVSFDIEPGHEDEKLSLFCGLTEDKELIYQIEVAGKRWEGQFDLPYTLEAATQDEEKILEAKYAFDQKTLENQGRLTQDAMQDLASAYFSIGYYKEAAECYRDLMQEFPHLHFEKNVADAYKQAGKDDLARKWYAHSYEYKNDEFSLWDLVWAESERGGWGCARIKELLTLNSKNSSYYNGVNFQRLLVRYCDAVGDRDKADSIRRAICRKYGQKVARSHDKIMMRILWDYAKRIGDVDLEEAAGRRYSILMHSDLNDEPSDCKRKAYLISADTEKEKAGGAL